MCHQKAEDQSSSRVVLYCICLLGALEQYASAAAMRSIKKRYNMRKLFVPFSGCLNLHSGHCCRCFGGFGHRQLLPPWFCGARQSQEATTHWWSAWPAHQLKKCPCKATVKLVLPWRVFLSVFECWTTLKYKKQSVSAYLQQNQNVGSIRVWRKELGRDVSANVKRSYLIVWISRVVVGCRCCSQLWA